MASRWPRGPSWESISLVRAEDEETEGEEDVDPGSHDSSDGFDDRLLRPMSISAMSIIRDGTVGISYGFPTV